MSNRVESVRGSESVLGPNESNADSSDESKAAINAEALYEDRYDVTGVTVKVGVAKLVARMAVGFVSLSISNRTGSPSLAEPLPEVWAVVR